MRAMLEWLTGEGIHKHRASHHPHLTSPFNRGRDLPVAPRRGNKPDLSLPLLEGEVRWG